MLPVRPPPLKGWDVATYYQPVIQIGGDIFDWIRLPDGSSLFWIADVTGHGVSAALHTALIKLLFRHAASEISEPSKILDAVNTGYYSVFKGKSSMTAACVALRSGDSWIRFAGAGHPPLFIIRSDAAVAETLASLSPPIGISPTLRSEESAAVILPGDTLLLYTDGLYSATGGRHTSHARGTPPLLPRKKPFRRRIPRPHRRRGLRRRWSSSPRRSRRHRPPPPVSGARPSSAAPNAHRVHVSSGRGDRDSA